MRNERTRSIFARFINFCWRLIKLIVLVGAVGIAGGVAYYHYQGQEMLRMAVERRLREPYGHLAVSVASARLVGEEGIEIRGIRVVDPKLSGPAADLVYVDEAFVRCSTALADLLHDRIDVRNIELRRPRLRCTRLSDGTWSAASLVQTPQFGGGAVPTVLVEDGVVEVVERREDGTPQPLTFREVQLTISPQAPSTNDASSAASKPVLRVKGSLVSDHFRRLVLDAMVSPKPATWKVRGTIEDLQISSDLWDALPLAQWASVAPPNAVQGRADLGFALSSGNTEADPLQFSVDGQLTQARVHVPGLPEPLTDVTARFQGDNRSIKIDDLTARFAQAKVRLAVTRYGWAAGSPLSLTGSATGLRLDERLPAMLPHVLGPVWEKFSPAGVVNADWDLKFDGRAWTPDVKIHCSDVSLAYERVPYRVHHASGLVHWKENRLVVDLRAMAGDAPLRIEGEFQDPGPDYSGHVEVASEGLIAMDEKLFSALDVEGQRIVRPLGARGWFRFSASLDRPSARVEPTPHLVIVLHDCSIEYDKFPYPIRQVRGTLEMHGRHWSFRDLEGRNDSGFITCAGRWLPAEPEGGQLTLDLVGSDIPLEDELREALASLSPESERLWLGLRPRGNLDHLTVSLEFRSWEQRVKLDVRAQKWPQSQNVEGRTITIDPEWFPYRLDDVTGIFHYRDGHIEVKNLRARHDRVTLSADAHSQVFDDGRWQLRFDRLNADRLTADDDLIAALPARLARAVERLNVRGPVAVSGSLQLDGTDSAPDRLAAGWDLVFDLENGGLGCGIELNHIHGGVRLVGGSQGEEFQSQGELAIDSLMWQGVQFTQLRGPLFIDSSQLLCGAWAHRSRGGGDQPRRLTAGLFGGTFETDARVAFNEEGRFDVDAQLIAGDLTQLATETMARQQRLTGKAHGTLQLTGNCRGTHSLKGRGKAQLVEADIYELPLMVALLKILSVRRPDKTAFTESDIDFRIEGDHVYLDHIDFHGDIISLKGKGSVGLDRHIEGMEFYTLVGPDALRPFFLAPVLGEASRQILVIRVAGSLDDPKTSKDAFPALNETLQRLFPELTTRRDQREESHLPSPRELLQGGLFRPRR